MLAFQGEGWLPEPASIQSQESPGEEGRVGQACHLPNTVSVSRRFFPSLSHKRSPRCRGFGSSELRWLSCIRTSTCLGMLLALEQKGRQWSESAGHLCGLRVSGCRRRNSLPQAQLGIWNHGQESKNQGNSGHPEFQFAYKQVTRTHRTPTRQVLLSLLSWIITEKASHRQWKVFPGVAHHGNSLRQVSLPCFTESNLPSVTG